MFEDYEDATDPGNEPLSPWEEIELSRRRHAYRVLMLTVGGNYVEIARAFVLNTGRGGFNVLNVGKATAALVRAVDTYQEAGLGGRARVAWRYARLLDRARWRAAT